jgi:hypothetical protein
MLKKFAQMGRREGDQSLVLTLTPREKLAQLPNGGSVSEPTTSATSLLFLFICSQSAVPHEVRLASTSFPSENERKPPRPAVPAAIRLGGNSGGLYRQGRH